MNCAALGRPAVMAGRGAGDGIEGEGIVGGADIRLMMAGGM